MSSKAVFSNQEFYVKPYYKSYLSTIVNMEGFTKLTFEANLQDTPSILFFLLKESHLATYLNANGFGKDTYKELFNLINQDVISNELLSKIIHLFDDNINNLIKIDDINYKLVLKDKELVFSSADLYNYLSSGTTKVILLYADIMTSLKNGNDIIIDEIENHFHKTLVENIINLYKDKSVNKHNATLYFSTHYPELLDLFNRRDNIYICRQENKIILENLYQTYPIRNELSKSHQFYNNAFKTEVNYDDLLDLRPFHARQLASPILIPILNQYHGEIIIYRIGDKMNDKLKINKEYKEFIKGQYRFCAKPELEILLIIVENKLNAFKK